MQSHCYENDFDLHENETACRTHFHMIMKGFALGLVLKQRHKRTRKWPIIRLSLDKRLGTAKMNKRKITKLVTNLFFHVNSISP